jgi:hypothetical protein
VKYQLWSRQNGIEDDLIKSGKGNTLLRPIYTNSGFHVAPCHATSRNSHYTDRIASNLDATRCNTRICRFMQITLYLEGGLTGFLNFPQGISRSSCRLFVRAAPRTAPESARTTSSSRSTDSGSRRPRTRKSSSWFKVGSIDDTAQGQCSETCSNWRHSKLRLETSVSIAALRNIFYHLNLTIFIEHVDVTFEVEIQYLR